MADDMAGYGLHIYKGMEEKRGGSTIYMALIEHLARR